MNIKSFGLGGSGSGCFVDRCLVPLPLLHPSNTTIDLYALYVTFSMRAGGNGCLCGRFVIDIIYGLINAPVRSVPCHCGALPRHRGGRVVTVEPLFNRRLHSRYDYCYL